MPGKPQGAAPQIKHGGNWNQLLAESVAANYSKHGGPQPARRHVYPGKCQHNLGITT